MSVGSRFRFSNAEAHFGLYDSKVGETAAEGVDLEAGEGLSEAHVAWVATGGEIGA